MHTAQVGDTSLYYEIAGDGEPLLLIHGLGSSTRDWETQVRCLAERYRVVAPDLRGHGRSDKPPGPYSIPLFAGDIAELMGSLDSVPAHVVGISLGGFVGFQLAVDHPELVRSLVVVNSAPGLRRSRWQDRLRLGGMVLLRRLIVRFFGMRALGKFVGKRLFPRPEQEELRRTFVNRWAENDKKAYLATIAAISGWSVEDRLGSVTCPTCVVAGEHDFIPLALKKSYTAELPNAQLVVIPGSGHLTPVDAPEKFNEAVTAFLADRRRSLAQGSHERP